MTFRTRLTVVAAVAVAAAVIVASAVVYLVVGAQLRRQVDNGLRDRAATISGLPFIRLVRTGHPGKFLADLPPPVLGGAAGYNQRVHVDGDLARPLEGDVPLPITAKTRAVAAGTSGTFFSQAQVANTHVRLINTPLRDGWALQVARPLTETDQALSRIRLYLILVGLGGVAGAAALGLAVTRAAIAPVRRLTTATEHVRETGDLGSRIEVGPRRDEVTRLAESFNAMLAALEESARSQRQLVQDASHELRTPLTSLRTNIEVLLRDPEVPESKRELLQDVVEQVSEMSTLVAELVELARSEPQLEALEVRLAVLVAAAIERARRSWPEVEFHLDADETVVRAAPTALERAVFNLLDNAGKWSPAGATVEVIVHGGEITVRDHGPGIADADLPYIFDRFYRAPAARSMPGSGLGLAVVKQVADAHGGEVIVERAGGGTGVRLRLPCQAARYRTNSAPTHRS
jgi:two-component system sensor histidine kinase MprB